MSKDEGQGKRPIRVALSNDYEIALLGLAGMLAGHPETVQVVGLTTHPELPHNPDLILFDTFGRVPEDDEKLRMITQLNPAKVVVYSWDDYPEEVARRLGAAGYLHKSLGAEDLVAGIVAIHEGRPVPPAAGRTEPVITWPGQSQGLSEREAHVLTLIVRGLTNQEIAERSYLSPNTVKTYIRTAYKKIGVRTRAQAVAWGFRHGFDSTDATGP